MATEVKRLIRVRVEKGARFKRDGFGKKRQLSDSWRKPRGQHSKKREQKKAKGALPKPGFGSPVAVRGMHPSGYFEVLVSSLKELEGLDSSTQAVRIAANVGRRKRMAIQDQAITAGLRVLNARVAKAAKKLAKALPVKKDEEAKEKAEKKPVSSTTKAVPLKKEPKKAPAGPKAEPKTEPEAAPEKKAEKAEKAKKIKKAPAKKPAVKPKAGKDGKAEKTEKKAPAKKPAAKPKAEKTADAKPKAPAKPRAKTTKSGVKKNE